MQIATETERKYDVPGDFALPDVTGHAQIARPGDAETHELDATYFDTDELLLARHRRTLRRRTGGSDAGWHLKTPGDGTSRTEHRMPLGDDPGRVPDELLAEVRAIVRTAPLRPVARLRTRRVETPLLDDAGRTLALVAQDDVLADTDDGEQRWTELEVELVDGGPKVLKTVEKQLVAGGATPAGGPSKLARALDGRLSALPTREPAPTHDPVLAYAREQRDAIVANDPAARRGEDEGVHRMRVATRRLRSTLRTFKDSWPADRTGPLRAELKWLADQLGGVRDGQVLTRRLTAAAESAGPDVAPVVTRVRQHLAATVEAGRAALGAALDGERYLQLLDDLDALVDAPPPADRGTRTSLRRARTALARADAMLDDATGHTGSLQDRDERLHDARKAFKQARYAVEVFVPTVGGPAGKLVTRLTTLQDVLGTHQDTAVARAMLRDIAGEAHLAGENGFPYGILYARQQQAGEDSLVDLPRATGAARRTRLRAWLA